MAKRPNLGQITSSVFTVSQLNTAYDKIDTAFDNTLSRDGSTPNTMLADLDMNSNDVLNAGSLYGTTLDVTEAYIGGKLFTGTLSWRSDWLTSTSYQKLDLVKKDGNVYVCLEEHTSGVFATDLSSSKWEIFIESAGGGGVEDHGGLTGLEDDDHTQYHNDTRGDVRYYTKAQVDSSLSGKANTSHTHSASDIASGTLDTARIADGSIGLTKLVDITNQIANQALVQVSTSTLKGRATAGTGNVEDLTGTQATALLEAFVGSGASHKKGLVPTPGATPGTTKFLREDATWAQVTESIIVAASDETTALTTGSAKATFRMPYAFTLTGVRASLTTAQASGSIFTVNISEGGASILSTKLTIDNTEKTSVTAATAAVISDTSLADDAEITIDIDQIGTSGAAGLKVTLIGYRT